MIGFLLVGCTAKKAQISKNIGASPPEAEMRLISTLWVLNFIKCRFFAYWIFYQRPPLNPEFWSLTLLEDNNSHRLS